MIIALDTHVMAYFEGVGDDQRKNQAIELVARAGSSRLVVPAQVLAELFHVLVRKAGRSRVDAARTVQTWLDLEVVVSTSRAILEDALNLVRKHGLQVFDAIVVSAAAAGRADILLSEDMQDGFAWGDTTIVNPFAEPPHPMLAALLR